MQACVVDQSPHFFSPQRPLLLPPLAPPSQVNLTWLDLSFNKITKIEGLEKLVKLEDVSLFNNQVRTRGWRDVSVLFS